MELNEFIKNQAKQFGIDICRITDGKDLKEERELLEKRKKSKYWPQAFTNQDLDQLTKPSLQFENLESIIVVAVNYRNEGDNPYLSDYVTVKDYHLFLKEKMQDLVDQIRKYLDHDFKFKLFVDTAPFLERALAKKAGVGFIGKNTMLINPEYGSNLFLGEIFTDLEIKKDSALDIDCGECRICIDNCEGGALKKEYLLAAEDCISYLTQKKGILSEKEIKKIGSHIWGCDACQSKCPYNKGKEKNKARELDFFNKDLEYFLKLERNNPPQELQNTAVMWRGSRILIRNALIAAANRQEIKFFELIKEKLDDNSPVIRYYAAYALLKIDYSRAKPIVNNYLKNEANTEVKKKINKILAAEEDNDGH